MAKTTEKKTVPVEEIPQVAALVVAEERLQDFISQNEAICNELKELIEQRNASLNNAAAVVREMGVSCGPFVLISESTKVAVEKLFEELGEEAFRQVGGYTEETTLYKLDNTRFYSYLQSDQIPKEVVALCVKKVPSYKALPTYLLP